MFGDLNINRKPQFRAWQNFQLASSHVVRLLHTVISGLAACPLAAPCALLSLAGTALLLLLLLAATLLLPFLCRQWEPVLDGCKGAAVDGAGAMLPYRLHMLRDAIPLVPCRI